MTTKIIPERLAQLDSIMISEGKHGSFDQGACSMELVSWLAGEGFTDAPKCASPVLTAYTIRLNDRWPHEKRQQLKPFLPRMVGTGGDGLDNRRRQIAGDHVAGLLVPWLRLAGLNDQADRLDRDPSNEALSKAYGAAWRARSAAMDRLRAKAKQHLSDRGSAAAAAADADADAVAAADAGAAAVAAAVAAAAAAAAAVAAAAADQDTYSAAYNAARDYYREHPLPISQQIADLAAAQDGTALTLLDKMIKPEPPR